jgi:acetyl esterase
MHGGAFVGGSLDMPESDAVCAELAKLGVTCVSVDYRLVPWFGRPVRNAPVAVRYPLPLDDCEAAWRWLVHQARKRDLDPSRIHVGGASAGGALAVTLALRLVRATDAPPCGVLLAYPLLHAELPPMGPHLRRSLRGVRRLGTFTGGSVRWMARTYVGRDNLDRLKEALPGGADLTGFPPTVIVNSERDTLRASGEAFADELKAHDVRVSVECEPVTGHGHLNRPGEPAFDRSIARFASWLTRPDAV